jgi:hypothetical protein
LNDDIADDGTIDYSLTNKVPQGLRQAIAEGKKILVLINPPYAEATNFENIAKGIEAENKTGVAKTNVASTLMKEYGKASNELFTQFLARIAKEIPTATIAMFSTMKYVNAPNFEKFREVWKANYLGGFVVNNKSFEGLTGKFPIGFLVWKTDMLSTKRIDITEISTEVLDINAKPIGEKLFYNLPKSTYLNVWIKRPKANKTEVIPLKNAISPTPGKARVSNWSDSAIAYMYCGVNDLQHAEQQTVIYSSPYGGGNGFYITPENLWQAAIIFSVRRLVKPTWLNDRDQFLQPSENLTDAFKNNCIIWMLFNRCQRTASANDLEWNDKKWSIVNYFIPFTEEEVGAPDRFESDFMVQYLSNLTGFKNLSGVASLSPESKAVLAEGKKLWQSYFAHTDVRAVRDELKLNRPDVGWYQVRNALKKRNESGDYVPVSFKPFEEAYKILTEKLQPMVYELGFLRM